MLSLHEQVKQFYDKYYGREVIFTDTYRKMIIINNWNKNYIVGTIDGRDGALIRVKLSALYKEIAYGMRGDLDLYYLHEIAVVPTKDEIEKIIMTLKL